MRQTRTWLYAFLPVLYLAILLLLVAVQFSKKSDTFSQSLGDLTVSGKTSTAGQPAELTLNARGLVFSFDKTHALQAEGMDGTSTKIRPLAWAWKDGNVVVTFQQNLQLVFEKSEGGRSLLIHPVANEASKNFTLLRIPFGPEGGTRLVPSPRGSLVEVIRDNSRMLASVDGVRDRIGNDHVFVLTAGKNGFRPVRLDPLDPSMSVDLAWLTLNNAADGPAAESALNGYWDKAYAAWSRSTSFSTLLVGAWGREALRRGEYHEAYSKIQSLLDQDRKAWGFDALPYLGNMVELTAQQRKSVETASSRSQPDWAGHGRLWLDAAFYGPDGSADRVKRLLLESPLPETVSGLLAMFQNLWTLQSRQPSETGAARLLEVLRAQEPWVVRREGDLFVQTDEGLLDLRTSLILGRLWLNLSQTLANGPYVRAGAQLIASALSFQDTTGRLPEFLVTQDGKILRQEGWILPEEMYSVVRPAPDAETPLPDWGGRAFLRTASKVVVQKITDTEARFTLRFPVGSAEHIVITGVPAFDHITLHGIRWRTDPEFQSYTDGWSYSTSTKTLYVKIKHREELEDLVVHFQEEE